MRSVSTLVVALISSSVVITNAFAAPLRSTQATPNYVTKRQVSVDSTTLEEIANEIDVSLNALQGVTAIVTALTSTFQELQGQLGLDGSNDGSDDSGDDSGNDAGSNSSGDSGTGGDSSTDPSGSTDGSDDSGADDGTGNDNSD